MKADASANVVSAQQPLAQLKLDKDDGSITEQLNLNGTMNENMLLDQHHRLAQNNQSGSFLFIQNDLVESNANAMEDFIGGEHNY